MNRLDIDRGHETYADGESVAFQGLLIDGHPIDAPAVNLVELYRSLRLPGEYAIFTCGCGVPGCAYIEEMVHVTHEGNQVTWQLHMPVAYVQPDSPADLELSVLFEAWQRTAEMYTFVFDRAALENELASAAKWLLHETPAGTRFSPHGVEREDIEAIEAGLARAA